MKSTARRLHACAACITALLASTVLFTGCTDEKAVPTAKAPSEPLFDKTIEVAVPQGLGIPQNWQLVLDEWTAQTGANVEVREYDAGEMNTPMNLLLMDEQSRKRLPTAFVVPITRIPEMAVDGLISTIPAEQQRAEMLNWNDVFEGLRGDATYVGRNDLVVPISSPVLVCYYRRDLLEKAGLTPPATWAEYQKLLDTIGQWAPGMTAVEPWGPEYRATLFLARSVAFAKHPANLSFTFDLSTGNPLIENPGFVRALETSQAALAKLPAEVRKYTPADCRRDLLSGKAAIGIALEAGPDGAPTPFGPEYVHTAAPGPQPEPANAAAQETPVDLACVRLPGSTEVYNSSLNEWEDLKGKINYSALSGFSGLAIGVIANTDRQAKLAAWNLIGTLTLGNLEAAFPSSQRSVCRETQVPDGARWLNDDLPPTTSQSYVNATEASLADGGLATELPVISGHRYRAALTEELGTVVDAASSPPAAKDVLASVARRWRELTQEIGLARVHNSYRGAMGFPVVRSEPAE